MSMSSSGLNPSIPGATAGSPDPRPAMPVNAASSADSSARNDNNNGTNRNWVSQQPRRPRVQIRLPPGAQLVHVRDRGDGNMTTNRIIIRGSSSTTGSNSLNDAMLSSSSSSHRHIHVRAGGTGTETETGTRGPIPQLQSLTLSTPELATTWPTLPRLPANNSNSAASTEAENEGELGGGSIRSDDHDSASSSTAVLGGVPGRSPPLLGAAAVTTRRGLSQLQSIHPDPLRLPRRRSSIPPSLSRLLQQVEHQQQQQQQQPVLLRAVGSSLPSFPDGRSARGSFTTTAVGGAGGGGSGISTAFNELLAALDLPPLQAQILPDSEQRLRNRDEDSGNNDESTPIPEEFWCHICYELLDDEPITCGNPLCSGRFCCTCWTIMLASESQSNPHRYHQPSPPLMRPAPPRRHLWRRSLHPTTGLTTAASSEGESTDNIRSDNISNDLHSVTAVDGSDEDQGGAITTTVFENSGTMIIVRTSRSVSDTNDNGNHDNGANRQSSSLPPAPETVVSNGTPPLPVGQQASNAGGSAMPSIRADVSDVLPTSNNDRNDQHRHQSRLTDTTMISTIGTTATVLSTSATVGQTDVPETGHDEPTMSMIRSSVPALNGDATTMTTMTATRGNDEHSVGTEISARPSEHAVTTMAVLGVDQDGAIASLDETVRATSPHQSEPGDGSVATSIEHAPEANQIVEVETVYSSDSSIGNEAREEEDADHVVDFPSNNNTEELPGAELSNDGRIRRYVGEINAALAESNESENNVANSATNPSSMQDQNSSSVDVASDVENSIPSRLQVSNMPCPTCRQDSAKACVDKELLGRMLRWQEVPCRFEDCPESLRIPALREHEAVCQHAHVSCPYKEFGCTWSGKRSDLPRFHLQPPLFTAQQDTVPCHFFAVSGFIEQHRLLQAASAHQASQFQAQLRSLAQTVHRQQDQLYFLQNSQQQMQARHEHLSQQLRQYQQQQNDRLQAFDRRHRNVFDILSFSTVLLCRTSSLVPMAGVRLASPGQRNSPLWLHWKPLFATNEARATVYNCLAVSPSLVLACKVVLAWVCTWRSTMDAFYLFFQVRLDLHDDVDFLDVSMLAILVGLLGLLVGLCFCVERASTSWAELENFLPVPSLRGEAAQRQKYPVLFYLATFSLTMLISLSLDFLSLGAQNSPFSSFMHSLLWWSLVAITSTYFPVVVAVISARLVGASELNHDQTSATLADHRRFIEPWEVEAPRKATGTAAKCLHFALRYGLCWHLFGFLAMVDASAIMGLVSRAIPVVSYDESIMRRRLIRTFSRVFSQEAAALAFSDYSSMPYAAARVAMIAWQCIHRSLAKSLVSNILPAMVTVVFLTLLNVAWMMLLWLPAIVLGQAIYAKAAGQIGDRDNSTMGVLVLVSWVMMNFLLLHG